MKFSSLKTCLWIVGVVLLGGLIFLEIRREQDHELDRRLVELFRSSSGRPWQWKAKEVIYDYNQVGRALLVRHDYMGSNREIRRRLKALEKEIRIGQNWKERIREYCVPKVPGSVLKNGFPDETFWKDSSLHWTGEYRLNQTELQNNSARWYLGYDSEYLYFKASFPDESICLAATDSLYEADSFELFILPEERYHTYVELVFSPDGRQYTRWVSQTTRSRYELSDYAPESLRSRTEKLKTGWSIEGRIGFRDLPAYLRGNPACPGETLRLMMLRIDRSGKGTRTVSTPVPFLYDGHNIFAYMKLTLQESRETKQ